MEKYRSSTSLMDSGQSEMTALILWFQSAEQNSSGWFSLVWFYGISTIVGYLMPNHFYSYIMNINDLSTYLVDNFFKRA